MLTAEQQDALVREASRAPSVHNVQPARWRFTASGDVELLRAAGRSLPVGDPTGHDLAASLGAAWEGMAIALSRIGCALGPPVMVDPAAGAGRVERAPEGDARGVQAREVVMERGHDADVRGTAVTRAIRMTETRDADGRLPGGGAPPLPVARATLRSGGTPVDSLADHVMQRRSHRGRFATPSPATVTLLQTLSSPDAIVVSDRRAIANIAAMHDRATWHFERDPRYHAELWSWLRLGRSHPDWSRDGLNADCLALSRAERAAAAVLMRPRVFALLARAGVARHLVSERASVRSAAGILLFVPRRDEPAFDVGRRFYRLWLQLTALGLHAAPMSATSDFAGTRDEITRRFDIPAERRLANVLRVGVAANVAESPRLPVRELVV